MTKMLEGGISSHRGRLQVRERGRKHTLSSSVQTPLLLSSPDILKALVRSVRVVSACS